MAKSPVAIIFGTNAQELTLTASSIAFSGTLGTIGAGVDEAGIVRFSRIDVSGSTFVTGNIVATPERAPVSTQVNLSASVTSIILLSGNLRRAQAIIFNDSPSEMYIMLGPSASYSAGFTYDMWPYSTLELPQPIYNGVVSGVWQQQTGSARVTELKF